MSRMIGIVGAGGMARDALVVLDAIGLASKVSAFFESDAVWHPRTVHGFQVRRLSELDTRKVDVIVALGSGAARQAIVENLPETTRYPTYLHPSVTRGRAIDISEGVIVCAGSVLTIDIRIQSHVQINVCNSITHDCDIGAFSTISPGVRLSGNCILGRRVFIGTGASLREKVSVADDAIIGMGAVVLTSLSQSGTYVGCPARRVQG